MRKKERNVVIRLAALILIAAMLCPIGASAVEPRASYYLDSYNAYPYAAGSGKVQVWFHVTGVDYMDDIGSLSIQIYESTDNSNFSFVDSYNNGNTPSMLGHDKIIYQSHVTYSGVAGRYYKAYVCIYAGDSSGGDTRYFWTGSVKAT